MTLVFDIYGQIARSLHCGEEFPVLAKYRWARPRWTPLVEAGPSFRLSGNLNGYDPSPFGTTAGFGIEKVARGIRLAPTVRYTRWIGERSSIRNNYGVYQLPATNHNAVEIFLGVSF